MLREPGKPCESKHLVFSCLHVPRSEREHKLPLTRSLGLAPGWHLREDVHSTKAGGDGASCVQLSPAKTPPNFKFSVFVVLIRFVDGESAKFFRQVQHVLVALVPFGGKLAEKNSA